MAGAGTIGEFSNGISHTGVVVLPVLIRFIVVAMTPGAGARIGGKTIVDILVVIGVTRNATYVTGVVARIIAVAAMGVVDRCPGPG